MAKMKSLPVDKLSPFCPGARTLVILLLGLQSIAVALMVNSAVALSVVTILATAVIKIYKVNTEPVLLLLLHTVVSCSMLSDIGTTIAVICASVAVAITIGDYDLSAERVTVFIASILVTTLLSKGLAIVSVVVMAMCIAVFKLRPVRPPTMSLLALALLSWATLTNHVFASLVAVFFMGVSTLLFVVNKILNKDRYPTSTALVHRQSNGSVAKPLASSRGHSNNNNNIAIRHQQPVPSGYLELSNTNDSLDLHGHTVTGAMNVLHKFLRENEDAYRENRSNYLRHVTVITGQGDPDDELGPGPLLKPTVINFLKINKYKYEVSRETAGLVKVDLESHVF